MKYYSPRIFSLILGLTVAISASSVAAEVASPVSSSSKAGTISSDTDYTLGAGDRIQVSIYKIEDLSGEYLVLTDGTIGFPLIGTLKVSGLTLKQLSEQLKVKYTAYIKRPVISAVLLSPRPLTIAVAGEIDTPGAYTISPAQGEKAPTLTDIIQKAGGVTASADISQVVVRRTLKNNSYEINLNLWKLLQKGDQSQNITLRDGDSIIIPPKQQISATEVRQLSETNFGIRADQEINIAIVGEVQRPGSYKVSPDRPSGTNDETVKELPRLSRAIQVAGGIKPLADVRNIAVYRQNRQGETQTFNIDLWKLLQEGNLEEDLILQSGDRIVVPTATAIAPQESEALAAASFSPARIRVNIVGEVNNPGSVEVPPNTPLNQAILAAGGFNTRRAHQESVHLIRLNPDGTVSKREVAIDFGKGINDATNPTLRNNDVVVVDRNALSATTDSLSTFFSPLGSLTGLFGLSNLFD
jgi:polysaccharide export outer membrane protein